MAPARSNVTLYCDIRGYPPPPISWFKDDTLIAHDGIIVYHTPTKSPLDDITTPHFVVTDRGNDTLNDTEELDGDVSGSGFPGLEPVEGNNHTLTESPLNYITAPPSVVTDRVLEPVEGYGVRERVTFRREVLVIVGALEDDSGLYECRGRNLMGSVNSSAYVLIGGESRFDGVYRFGCFCMMLFVCL